MKKVFTSESVTSGHPDKICDQISDAVLDACLAQDANSRVACETAIHSGLVVVMGEISTRAQINVKDIVKKTIRDIGYKSEDDGFGLDGCKIIVSIKEQSADIAQGVDKDSILGKKIGAGDQGMMFGYACSETDQLMPLPIVLAHKITQELEKLRNTGILKYLRPDGKAQVSVEYNQNDKPEKVSAIVISAQHDETVEAEKLKVDMMQHVIKKCIPAELIDDTTRVFINPTGRFVIGGPNGDSGLTGRKIIVDTYGGMAKHGGGAFSGKDCTKVDRSAAYAARYIAKNIVASGLAEKCEIQLAYAIGVSEPVSVNVNTYGTGRLSDDEISDIIKAVFDLTPEAIIDTLNLRRPIFQQTACYGHFGRTESFAWESTDKVEILRSYFAPLVRVV